MAKTYQLPNLENMTTTGLVDLLADCRERMKEAKFYEGLYKEALAARWPKQEVTIEGQTVEKDAPEVNGEKYVASRQWQDSERIDIKKIRADAAAGDELAVKIVEKYLTAGGHYTVYTKEKAKVNKALVGV